MLDFGGCAISPTGQASCAHTFQNTNIYITPTGNTIIVVGIGFLIVSLMVFLFGQTATKKNKTTMEADPLTKSERYAIVEEIKTIMEMQPL